MKITVFNGSPRGPKSNTHVMADAFMEGAKEAGAEVHNVFLIQKNIMHCTGCFNCWFKTPGQCVLKDDMAELIHLYLASDIVIYGTPIYLWSMTACLKNFLDRLIPLKSPTVQENQGRYDMKDQFIKNPKVIILSNAGFPGEHNFDIFKMTVKPADPILEIYRNCGMALQTKDTFLKNRIDDYLSFVHQAGYQMALHEEVTAEVRTGLNMQLMTEEAYLQYISKGNKA